MLSSFSRQLRRLALCGLLVAPGGLYAGEEITFSTASDGQVAAGEPAVVTVASANSAIDPSAEEMAALLDQDDEGSVQQASAVESPAVKEYCCSKYGRSLCCDPCCNAGRCTPFLGVAATFLAPIHNNASSGSTTVTDVFSGTVTGTGTNTASGMIVSPRLWVGFVGPSGWGASVRYWRYTNVQNGIGPIGAAGAGTVSSSLAQLQMQTLDVELLRAFGNPSYNPKWFSIGMRYAQFQDFTGTSSNNLITGPGLASNSAFSGSDFYGVGLTTGLFGKRRLNCCSPWSFFWGGRASILWDNSGKTFAATSASITGPIGVFNTSSAFSSGNQDVFIGEAQLGTQYDRALKCVRGMNAFFRVAGEYQYWNLNPNGGTHANSSAALTTIRGATLQSTTATAQAGGAVLDMLGFNIATGFYW